MIVGNEILNKKIVNYLLDPHIQIQKYGVNLTVNRIYMFESRAKVGFDNTFLKKSRTKELEFNEDFKIKLDPGSYLVKFNEKISSKEDVLCFIYSSEQIITTGISIMPSIVSTKSDTDLFAILNVFNPCGVDLYKHASIAFSIFEEIPMSKKPVHQKIFNSIKDNLHKNQET